MTLFVFYELNPAVADAAKHYFSYLSDSDANVDIVVGDGRVSLANEWREKKLNQFDLLVVDAFSGDSIPQHLLTVEAMKLYWQHMKKDGIIAIHISNTHLNLLPLMKGLAQESGKTLSFFLTKADSSGEHDTQWVWLSTKKKVMNSPFVKAYLTPIDPLSAQVYLDRRVQPFNVYLEITEKVLGLPCTLVFHRQPRFLLRKSGSFL